jgi:hypothetical protein
MRIVHRYRYRYYVLLSEYWYLRIKKCCKFTFVITMKGHCTGIGCVTVVKCAVYRIYEGVETLATTFIS